MKLPEIPQSWLILLLMIGLVTLRAFGIDSWTTAALSVIIGYLTGKHIEQKSHTDPIEAAKILATAQLTVQALKENKKK